MIYISTSCIKNTKIKDSVEELATNGFKNIELSDEEKSTLASLQTSPQGVVLAKVLGPDLTKLGSILEPKTKRGLAARKPAT